MAGVWVARSEPRYVGSEDRTYLACQDAQCADETHDVVRLCAEVEQLAEVVYYEDCILARGRLSQKVRYSVAQREKIQVIALVEQSHLRRGHGHGRRLNNHQILHWPVLLLGCPSACVSHYHDAH